MSLGKKTVVVLATILLGCTGCSGNNTEKGIAIGAGSGAVIGGVASGSVVGMAAGAAIGGIVGGVIGSDLDSKDRKYMEDSIQIALDTAYQKKFYKWVNSSTGTSGEMVLIDSYVNINGMSCGDFAEYIEIKKGSKTERHKVKIKACRNHGDKWHIVQ